MKMNKGTLAIVLSATVTLGLAGCGFVSFAPAHMEGMMNEADSKFSSTDLMFARMMIPHHQQAVDMGTLAETRSQNPEVKELASKIKAAQAPEIIEMKSWLPNPSMTMGMDHGMTMAGMLTDSEMLKLANAYGAEFDKLYLSGMIGHHKGAITMVQMIADSRNLTVKAFGEKVVTNQSAEITSMQQLMTKLGY
jgi:uncharacterized protein (DUF305 family)